MTTRSLIWPIALLIEAVFASGARRAAGFGNTMEAPNVGRIGNTVTLKGATTDELPLRAGERVRLRLVNSSLARIMSLSFEGYRPIQNHDLELVNWGYARAGAVVNSVNASGTSPLAPKSREAVSRGVSAVARALREWGYRR